MRARRSGHIIQVTSLGGITAFPAIGAYHASKWALEGLSQSLAQEVAGFGIKVTLVEPGGYSTDWVGPSAKRSAENPAYADSAKRKAARGPRIPATRRPPAARSSRWSMPTSHRCASSSAKRPWRLRPRTTSHAWRHGTSGSPSRSRLTGNSILQSPSSAQIAGLYMRETRRAFTFLVKALLGGE
jgi:NAD(P)-dependent dehydrogenase (short-subunit alcohol dehydrogenase family)